MDKPDSPIKTALQKLRLPKPRGNSAPSSSPASETAQLPGHQDSEKLSGKHSAGSAGTDSTSEWELPELSDAPQHPQREPSAKEKVDTSGAGDEKTSAESKLDHLDPKVAGAVLVCSLLVLWRPSFSLLLALLAVNIVLGFALVMVCAYIRQLGSFGPSTAAGDSPDADVKSTVGLQQLLSPGWIRMRTIVNQRDFQGVVTAVELGAQPPEVTFVRSANSPCDGVVCYNIGLNLCAECAAAPGIPYVQMEVKVPGYSNPWVFRMKLLALDITVQLYFWSLAPEGRGSGRPYSLIEAALCPEPAKPHLVKVALETMSDSPIFESVLSRCEPVASAVICSHVLPRFTGFQNRVILEEGQAVQAHIKKKESAGWQQNARRAGWQPRAEAAVESVKALGQMFSEAGGFAYEAMANTAASAAAQAAGAARLLKSSFGMDH